VPLTARIAEGRRFSVIHSSLPVLLDHILVSKRFAARCEAVMILNQSLQDEVTAEEPVLASLHAPIVASFDLGKS
jgi:exonuclease III